MTTKHAPATPLPWRNYAHEVVTDVMHNQMPSLSVAQRARDQVEQFHDDRERLVEALRAIKSHTDKSRDFSSAAAAAQIVQRTMRELGEL